MALAILYGVVFHASPSTTLPSRSVTLIGVFSLAGERMPQNNISIRLITGLHNHI